MQNPIWVNAIYTAVSTIKTQQLGTAQDIPPAYSFQRQTVNPTGMIFSNRFPFLFSLKILCCMELELLATTLV